MYVQPSGSTLTGPGTASIGVATERAGDSGRLMDLADRAVYQAKAQGRDRVAVHEPVPAT